MSTEFVERTVKIEEGTENVTEIQSYLAGFQKEIGDSSLPSGAVVIATQGDEADEDQDGEEGTYFVDQAGHYYFQAKGDSDPKPVIMSAVPQHNGDDYMDVQESEDADEQDDVPPVVANTTSNQILINSGNAYQRVTMVPDDGGSGEVSYVLIMQDPDIKDGIPADEDQDMGVYDFDDQEGSVQLDSDDEDDKSKIVKVIARKNTQTATQALHMCNYCNYTSSKRYLLSRHMKSHSEERPHKCSVCERGFKTIASLQNHINTHTGTKPHLCKFCEAAFTTSGELVRHVRYRHTHEKPHKCKECDYASVELSKLKRHIRCHTGERPYQCPHCTYASPDTFKLKRHLRIHTGEKPYECEICAARFTQSNSLKAHRLTHNAGDRPVFQCEMCPTTCGRKTDLRIHVQKLHTSDKPIKCRRCGKAFPDRYSYKMHSKSHEGEKCFKCDLCPYASASPRHLESHVLIHTDQKPYECDLCDQSFSGHESRRNSNPTDLICCSHFNGDKKGRRTTELSPNNMPTKNTTPHLGQHLNESAALKKQKQLLKRHQNLYHNPEYIPPKPKEKNHECPDCKRPFRHKGNLIRHMAAHDPDPLIQRKNLELKLGRQKKVQMVDGQQVDMMNSSLGSDEEDELDMMAMEGSDGQQYVVLEVIQLADGEEQAMVVRGETSGSIVGMDGVMQNSGLDDDVMTALQSARGIEKHEEEEDKKPIIPSTETDMQNCFGFDEEEEDDQQRGSLTDFL